MDMSVAMFNLVLFPVFISQRSEAVGCLKWERQSYPGWLICQVQRWLYVVMSCCAYFLEEAELTKKGMRKKR